MRSTRRRLFWGLQACVLLAVGILAFHGVSLLGAPAPAQATVQVHVCSDGQDSTQAKDLKTLAVSFDPSTGSYSFQLTFYAPFYGLGSGDSVSIYLDVDKDPNTGYGWGSKGLGSDYVISLMGSSSGVTRSLIRSPSGGTAAWTTLRTLDGFDSPALNQVGVTLPQSAIGSPAGFNLLVVSSLDSTYFDFLPDSGIDTFSAESGSGATTTTTAPGPSAGLFSDVPSSYPYSAAINSMANLGFIGGYTNGCFGPNDLVTRQQFAKMAVLALGLQVSETDYPSPAAPFVDLGYDDTSSLYPHEYVSVCARCGITRGVDATHFAPGRNITRAQVISMMVRAVDNLSSGTLALVPIGWIGQLSSEDPNHGANIQKAEYNGLLAGIQGPSGSLSGWNTAVYATRGEVAQMLLMLWYKLPGGSGSGGTTPSSTTTTTVPSGPREGDRKSGVITNFTIQIVNSQMGGVTATVRLSDGSVVQAGVLGGLTISVGAQCVVEYRSGAWVVVEIGGGSTGTTNSTTTTTAVSGYYRWGHSADVSGLRITVGSPFTDSDVLVWYNGARDYTMKVILVEVTVKNVSSSALTYGRTSFTLHSVAGGTYGTFGYSTADLAGYQPLGTGTLNAGGEVRGYIAYIVPLTATASSIEYRRSTSSSKADAVWGN